MSDTYGNIPISPDKPKRSVGPSPTLPSKKSAPSQKPLKKQPFRKRYILIALIFPLLFVGYFILSSFLVPIFIEKKFPEIFLEKTGLRFYAESAQFNPFECSITLDKIRVDSVEDDGSANDLLTIDALYADLDFTSLLRNGIVSDKLEINGATLSILRRTDKSYNISQFFKKNNDTPSEIMDFGDLPFLYSLNNISLTDGTIVFNDLISKKVHRVEKLRISLPTLSNFSFDADNYIQPRFSAIINGSPVEMVSETATSGQKDGSLTTLSCSLQSIDIPLYSHYLPVPFPVEILKGRADGKLKISFHSKKDKNRYFILNYQFQAKNVQLASHDDTLSLFSPILSVDGSLKPLTGEIEIKNFIFRDPALTVEKTVTSATIDSLFLTEYDNKKTGDVHLKLPSLSIALLIADNGRIVIKKDNKEQVFESVQLSMRNFSNGNDANRKSNPVNSTFHISGEAKNDFSAFSWRGNFNNNAPIGNLEINNLRFSALLDFLSPGTRDVADGSVDIRGILSTETSKDKTSVVSLSFKDGSVVASSITLTEENNKWFQAPSMKMAPVSYTEGRFNLGNIFIKDSELHIKHKNVPSLLHSFSEKDGPLLGGIDLKGNISFDAAPNNPPLSFRNVHFQYTGSAQKKDKGNNFAFSAQSGGNGVLRGRGKIVLTPFKGTIDLAFSDLPAGELLPWLSSAQKLNQISASVNGTGNYIFPEKKFTGALEITDGKLTNTEQKRVYSFNRGIFGDLSIGSNAIDFKGKNIALENFEIISDDLEIETGAVSVSAISWEKENLNIGDITFTDSVLTVRPEIPDLFRSTIVDRKGQFNLKKLKIDGSFNLFNKDREKKPLLDKYELIIRNLNNTPTKKNNVSFMARIGDSGKIQSNGYLSVKPVNARLTLQFTDIGTEPFRPLYSSHERYAISATLNGGIIYHYPEKMYSGNISLSNGKLLLNDAAELFNWKNATLHDFTHTQTPYHIGISRLDLDTPQFQFSQNNNEIFERIHNQINTLFQQENSFSSSSSVSISMVDIPRININNGTLDYWDDRIEPTWETFVSDIQGQINNFHISDSTNEFSFLLKGELETSPLSIEGNTLFSRDSVAASYSLDLSSFPLRLLDRQLENRFDIITDDGLLDLNFKRNDTKPDEANTAKYTISSLLAKDDSPETAQLLALLNNKDDNFTQDIVVKNNGNTLFTQTVNHFQKLLVKGSFSPFLLLPPPFSTLKDSNSLSFKAGVSTLSSDNQEILSSYASLIKNHPRLQLIFEAVGNTSHDLTALTKILEIEEKKRVKLENERLLHQWQQKHIIATTGTTAPENSILVEDIPTDELMAFTPVSPQPIVVSESMLRDLGKKRLSQVTDFLSSQHNIPPQNIISRDNIIIHDNTNDDTAKVHILLSHIQNNKTQSGTLQDSMH